MLFLLFTEAACCFFVYINFLNFGLLFITAGSETYGAN